jgi:hypothetical protein
VRALMIAAVFLLLDLGVGPVVVRGEDLAAAAAREKERRAGKSGRVITEDDLAKAHQSATPADESAAGATSEASGSAATSATPQGKSDEDLRAERAKAWRDRRDKLAQNIAQLEERIAELRQATADRRVYQYSAGRARQVESLKQAEEQLALAQQQLEDLDEEGRREGF